MNTRRTAFIVAGLLFATGSVFSQTWTVFSSNKAVVNSFLAASNGSLYIATEDSGLYRVTSGTTALVKCNLPAAPDKIRDLLEGKQGKLFAATYYGLYVSTDNGGTWTMFSPNFPEYNVRSLAMNNANGYIYAGTDYQYIMRSTDNGVNWSKVRDSSSKIRGIDYIEVNQTTGTVYAATGTYSDSSKWLPDCYSSSNNGGTWTRVTLPGAPSIIGYSLGTAPDGTVYISYRSYSAPMTINGIYRSTNDGGTWAKLDSGYAVSYVFSGNTLYGSAFGVNASTNKGQTWAPVGTGLPSGAIALNLVLYQGKLLASVRSYGIYSLGVTGVLNSGHRATPVLLHSASPERLLLRGRAAAAPGRGFSLSGRSGKMRGSQVFLTK